VLCPPNLLPIKSIFILFSLSFPIRQVRKFTHFLLVLRSRDWISYMYLENTCCHLVYVEARGREYSWRYSRKLNFLKVWCKVSFSLCGFKLHECSKDFFFKLLRSKDSCLKYKRKLDFRVIQNGFHLEATLYEIRRKRGKLVPRRGCKDICLRSSSGEGWIRCMSCLDWAHECAGIEDDGVEFRCDFCSKRC
jgi:hypothetical protein